MFDFGFSELLLIAMVALIVVGPERLPKVARTAGHMLGRLQRYVSDVKSDIQREMQLEDLKKLQQQVEQQAREIETSVRGQMAKVEADLGKTASDVRESLSAEGSDSGAAPVTGGDASAAARPAVAAPSAFPAAAGAGTETHDVPSAEAGERAQVASAQPDAGRQEGKGPQLDLELDDAAAAKHVADRSGADRTAVDKP